MAFRDLHRYGHGVDSLEPILNISPIAPSSSESNAGVVECRKAHVATTSRISDSQPREHNCRVDR